MPGARGSGIKEKMAAVADSLVDVSSLRSSGVAPASRGYWPASRRTAFDSFRCTRRHRADTCASVGCPASESAALTPSAGLAQIAARPSALFRPRPMTRQLCARSTRCRTLPRGLGRMLSLVPPAANWRDSQKQLGRSRKPRLQRPRGFARPTNPNYGRDAPHIAQDKTAKIAVTPASFASLRSQTGRTH
jgi:hypothetical protein